MKNYKSDLRAAVTKAGTIADHREHPRVQTHSVLFEGYRIRLPAYQDGDTLRHLVDGEVLANRTKRGWDQYAVLVPPRRLGEYDHIKALPGPAQRVHVSHGKFF